MELADLLLAGSLPQEQFEGHGILGFIILIAIVTIVWGIFSEPRDK